MAFAFDAFRKLGPAAFVLKAILAVIAADVLLLGFILIRRAYRKRFFAKRDALMLEIRQNWDAIVSGRIPYEAWRTEPSRRRIVDALALDALEVSGPEESARLLKFLRASGLIEKHVFEARQHRGWRRNRALLALGRTRAPEGIPALADGLKDRDVETRLAALRGLERIACPEAAKEILAWVTEVGLTVPALPLQCALISCCGERPQLLLPCLRHAEGAVREVLARVLGEVANPALGADLLEFADDNLDELRAATARAMSRATPGLAIEVLSELAKDSVWFVRLRAISSLGKLYHRDAIPPLLRGLTDSNRLVRWRAAEGLVDFKRDMVAIFEKVVATKDQYAFQAYLTALDNAGLQAQLEEDLKALGSSNRPGTEMLLEVLRTGKLVSAPWGPPRGLRQGGIAAMNHFLSISNHALFYYYLTCNLAYLAMLVIALRTSAVHRKKLESFQVDRIKGSALAPPITILTPAHNEEKSICVAVRNLLDLDYPELEVIVINDGSTDGTLELLKQEFRLRQIRAVYIAQAPSARVRNLYRSVVDPRLLVVDKEPGGSKADAVNAGLNAATSPYVCVVDADSVLERDALLRIMAPVLADPKHVVAVGGIVRVLNGSEIEAGQMRRVRLPRKSIEVIQVVEYLRAFLIGREAWARGNMLTIISGAFGVFKTGLVRAVGGYRSRAIGEDFDLVARMHRHLRDHNVDYRIHFVPDPVCWTEVPSDLSSLGKQRARWQKGLIDVLWPNRDMLFRARYGAIGCFALPYLWVFELLAPIIELGGIVTIALAACTGALSREFFLQFLIFGYAFATVISIGSVLQEELTFRRYNDWQDVARLVTFCFLEHFPYRQLHMVWRLQGLWQYFRGDMAWKPLKRQGPTTVEAKHPLKNT
jgi:cellulose synthase/poly-beta-1,6-N-acetylglucosamine synthase-like glycosyltransferase/HEAT repeat protein